jgi:hypothetical protein
MFAIEGLKVCVYFSMCSLFELNGYPLSIIQCLSLNLYAICMSIVCVIFAFFCVFVQCPNFLTLDSCNKKIT